MWGLVLEHCIDGDSCTIYQPQPDFYQVIVCAGGETIFGSTTPIMELIGKSGEIVQFFIQACPTI